MEKMIEEPISLRGQVYNLLLTRPLKLADVVSEFGCKTKEASNLLSYLRTRGLASSDGRHPATWCATATSEPPKFIGSSLGAKRELADKKYGKPVELSGGGHYYQDGNRRIVRLTEKRHVARDCIGSNRQAGRGVSSLGMGEVGLSF